MSFSFNRYCSDNLPAGKYKAIVTAAKFRTGADGSATKDIAVTYTIAEGEYAKRTVTDTIFEKATFRLRPMLQACGVDTSREFGTMDEMFHYGLKEMLNKTIMIDVVIKTYNGREYNNVAGWSPLPGSTTTVSDVLEGFGEMPTIQANKAPEAAPAAPAEEAKADVKADAKAAPAAPTAEAPKEPNLDFDVVDDDLPF
jgi:hypothetical protein